VVAAPRELSTVPKPLGHGCVDQGENGPSVERSTHRDRRRLPLGTGQLLKLGGSPSSSAKTRECAETRTSVKIAPPSLRQCLMGLPRHSHADSFHRSAPLWVRNRADASILGDVVPDNSEYLLRRRARVFLHVPWVGAGEDGQAGAQ
jgi:hypothetical protein